jgi:hypothetical protein
MTLTRQVFGQNAVAWPQAMNRAIAQPDLDCSRQRDYVLTARCVVPIGKSGGFDPAEGDRTGGLCRRLLRDIARRERKRHFLEMRLTVTTAVKSKDWHWIYLPQNHLCRASLAGLPDKFNHRHLRVTGGNFRLLIQIQRVLEIDGLSEVTKAGGEDLRSVSLRIKSLEGMIMSAAATLAPASI